MDKKILSDLDVAGKKVLVRVDFNVPQDAEGNITDDNRMVAALPTIQYLLDHEAAVILMSHLGRPKGEPNPKYTLKPIAKHLEELLGKPVALRKTASGRRRKKRRKNWRPDPYCC